MGKKQQQKLPFTVLHFEFSDENISCLTPPSELIIHFDYEDHEIILSYLLWTGKYNNQVQVQKSGRNMLAGGVDQIGDTPHPKAAVT
jgi:hypothetical protein